MRDDKNPKNNVNFNDLYRVLKLKYNYLELPEYAVMECFQCTGIPTSYYERGHFRVTNIKDSLSEGDCTTTLTAILSKLPEADNEQRRCRCI